MVVSGLSTPQPVGQVGFYHRGDDQYETRIGYDDFGFQVLLGYKVTF